MLRALEGLAVAACVALAARRLRSLSPSGTVAATIVGTCAVAAGWDWGALLIIYFLTSTALSRMGRATKEPRTASIVAKGGERDAVQVLANGAMFAGAALSMIARPDARWIALGAGSLAASAADTWATEIGTLYGDEPRSIISWRLVAVGTSGGVSMIGTLAAVAGATCMALVTRGLGWSPSIGRHVAIGGVAGAFVDSILGATIQARRWCEACHRETERTTHDCGAATRRLRGLAWLDNDLVNFVSAAAGGLLAALLSR